MMRVCDDKCAPAYWSGYWMGVHAGDRPLVDHDWIFTNRADGSTVLGRVVSCDADGWKIQQFNPETIRSLARSKWRPTWRVRSVHHCRGDEEEFHRSEAIGDHDRAQKVLLAGVGKGPMPAPLPASIAVPTIYELGGRHDPRRTQRHPGPG
jgi:hypothetical protein